jgi:predicted small lipoprotein YifL
MQVSVRTEYCNNRLFTIRSLLMRFSIVLLTCFMLLACGKTGALYLPEEPPAQPEPPEQNTQPQRQDTSTGEEAD